LLNTSPKVEREGRNVLSFFMPIPYRYVMFTWLAGLQASRANTQASRTHLLNPYI
jgi:hypothetical protein